VRLAAQAAGGEADLVVEVPERGAAKIPYFEVLQVAPDAPLRSLARSIHERARRAARATVRPSAEAVEMAAATAR
jgi:hypothetical protein